MLFLSLFGNDPVFVFVEPPVGPSISDVEYIKYLVCFNWGEEIHFTNYLDVINIQ